jgi:microcystin-dependent protein
VGTVISQASSASLGLDWGYCDGGSLTVSSSMELFARIGYTFGGSGANFNKPDLRGEFQRGWDDGRGIDTGRVFGSSQSDDNKAHVHTTQVNSAGDHNHSAVVDASGAHLHSISPAVESGNTPATAGASTGSDFAAITDNGFTSVSATQSVPDHTHTSSIANAGGHTHSVLVDSTGTESRPRNVALKFFIKLYTPPMLEPVDVVTSQSISGQKTFLTSLIVPELPQAIIFGNPVAAGTKALGIIGGQMVVTMHVSGGTWTPLAWLT